ncbi:hypothetical protein FTX61_19060 [Nitriliruptoraceae bacterium ZYF776]|nr:hypothetical protein [Profundirhabdus halotolerans]
MTRDARTGTDDTPRTPQLPLPFDDAADEPIAYRLTARARRTVAPDELPTLRVVPGAAGSRGPGSGGPGTGTGAGDLDERSDTRPARARALTRAGVPVATIARQLQVDELLVRAWTGSTPAGSAVPVTPPPRDPSGGDAVASARTAFELARAAAADEVRPRLAEDPQLAAGLGLVAGIAAVDPHAVTLTVTDDTLAGAALRWLTRAMEVDPHRIRIVLRIAPGAAGDLLRHRWSRALDVPVDAITVARWAGAPSATSVEALVRVADPTVAATFAGWRDAFLLHATTDPADAAF